MKKILRGVFVIGVVSVLAFAATQAFFSDTEESTNNRFQAGAIDLSVDNMSYYNGELSKLTSWRSTNDLNDGQGPYDGRYLFFAFDDLKPGDWGEDTISLIVDDNPAYACMEFTMTANDDNTSVEPELDVPDEQEDPQNIWDGELAQNLYMVWWADDGDNVLEDNEYRDGEGVMYEGSLYDMGFDDNYNVKFALADSSTNIWDEEYMEGSRTYYIGKAWCFGGYTVAPVAQDGFGDQIDPTGPQGPGIECDPQGDHNIAQTDLVTSNLLFYAVQQRHNENFLCDTCERTGEGYASGVYAFNQGLTKGGGVVAPERSDPNNTLGSPNGVFTSLGYGGSLDVNFVDKVYDVPGEEVSILSFHEVTNGRDTYPEETADVYVSQNGSDWVSVGSISNRDSDGGAGVAHLDVGTSGLPWIMYVRIVDTTSDPSHNSSADGYDVDAIDAGNICLDDQVVEVTEIKRASDEL